MPRPPRIHIPHGLYFVTLRAGPTHSLISDEDDRIDLERLIARARDPCHVKVHAFCWLSRELHLAIQVADLPLGRFVQRITGPYARRRQRRTRGTGHLFADRYDATPFPPTVVTSATLAHLVRHIHRAPLRAGLASNAGDYRWSSHRAYLGRVHVPWLTSNVLDSFGQTRARARDVFDPFVNGNGVRDENFRALLNDATAFRAALKQRQRLPLPFHSLDELIDAVCRTHYITRDQLSSHRVYPNASLCRALIAWHATRSGLTTLTQVAQRLGRHPSTLSVAIDRQRVLYPHLFRHPKAKIAR